MPKAPIGANESDRLRALRETGLLDTPPKPGFDDLTTLVARLCNVPISLVSLVDENRQWFKSCVGLGVRETDRDSAFCAYTILADGPLVINDATRDPRTCDNALVVGPPHIRFYAGVPLRTAEGYTIGTLCAIDTVPREISAQQLDSLVRVAAQLSAQLELRAHERALKARTQEAERLAAALANTAASAAVADAKLRTSETRYRMVMESAIDAIFVHGPKCEIRDANRRACESLGYTRQELLGKHPCEFDPALTPEQMDAMLKTLDSGGTLAFESLHRSKDGVVFPVDIRVAPLTVDGERLAVSVVRDITERKNIESDLRSERERLQLALSGAGLGTWEWDIASGEIIFDARWCAMMREEQRSWQADEWKARLHPEDLPRAIASVETYLAGGSTGYESTYRVRLADGAWCWIHDRGVAVASGVDGRPTKLVGTHMDVTERRIRESRDNSAFELATRLARTEQVRDTAGAVMDALQSLRPEGGQTRCAVLVYGHDGVCRFVGSRGLSPAYCAAVEGHCPWSQHAMDAGTIVVNDVMNDAAVESFRELFVSEHIGSLAFVPLKTEKGVVGKIMLYDEDAGGISSSGMQTVENVAAYAGIAIGRIMAMRRMERSERRFRTLVEGADVIVWEFDVDKERFTYVSPQAARLGYPMEDWLQPGFWADHLHPDDRSEATKLCLDGVADRKDHRFEYRMLKADGTSIWIDDVVSVEQAEGRSPILRGVMIDISGRKEAERRMEAVTEMLARTGSIARVGGWEVDVASQHLTWSDEVYKIHEVAVGTPMSVERAIEFYAPEARDSIAQAVRRAVERGEPWDLELPLDTATGRRIYVRAQGEAVCRDGKPILLRGAFQDITERYVQREAITEQVRRLNEAEAMAKLGHWSCSKNRDAIEWSDEIFKIHRWDPRLGTPTYPALLALYEESSALELDSAFKRAIATGEPFSITLRTSDADERYLLKEAHPRHGAKGVVTGLYGTVRDVTDQVMSERRLHESMRAAEAANRAKSEFLANMSHEIRTPLTAILGFADVLREDGDATRAPERRIEIIDTIRSAGQHLLTVINDILDLSKIEAEKMTVERLETPLLGVISEVATLNRARLAGKGVELEVRLDNPLPELVMSDATRLRQILMNLVGNAVKFTEAGKVTISARSQGPSDPSNPATQNEPQRAGPRLVIEITDTGPGLNADQASRLFSAFSQADTTVTRKFGGTGLGLTICRRLAELMDGSVSLAWTQSGRGSCFRLELPLIPVPGSPMRSALGDATSPVGIEAPAGVTTLTGRILLAEDGLDNQRLIVFHLRKAGAAVEVAENGLVALTRIDSAAAEGKPFDLLLTDMQMPEMDGYTLARTLRQRGSQLPIVALTAHAMAEDRQKCTDAGCDDYASKPIDKARLLATCALWIGRTGGVRGRGLAA